MDFVSSPVTLTLIVINLIVTGYALYVDDGWFDRFGFQIDRVLRYRQYYRLATSGFLHVDAFHFIFNMLTLFFFGRVMERVLGPSGFLLLYFGSELAAQIFTMIWHRRQPGYAAVGASGAVTGVVFAFCLLQPLAKIFVFFIPIGIPAILYAGLFVLISLYAIGDPRTRIGHAAHIGGAIGGVVILALLMPAALSIFLSNFM
ncbi:MAG: rhomboid family intramembrane serine protease [Hyphomicrobiaceae bacterium]|nr:rhomboid family intramembrane serine protease [Hyphomicrobiaceae bacterium]